jgi:hypothetical protein
MRSVCAGLLSLVGSVAFVPGTSAALPIIQSTAEAFSDESGGDPGSDTDSDQTSVAGATVQAHALRCAGAGPCALDPQLFESAGGHARARTDFGVNRARAFGNDGPDPLADSDVVDGGSASSLWVDEWTVAVPLQSVGLPIAIDLQLEGSWRNTGSVRFAAAVADSTLPPVVDPDDPFPFLDLEGRTLSSVGFDSAAGFAFNGVAPFIVPVPDGGEPDGNADLTLTLSFVPVPGRTYLVAARLAVEAGGEHDQESADFESTARVTRVVLPGGVSFATAAGASWNSVVAEPAGPALLLLAAGALLTRRRRGSRPVA